MDHGCFFFKPITIEIIHKYNIYSINTRKFIIFLELGYLLCVINILYVTFS